MEFLARSADPSLWGIADRIRAAAKDLPGVKLHLRVPQALLAGELQRAGVWCYPCTYPETSCVAGLHAAAAGCIPVYQAEGAMAETMPDDTYAIPWGAPAEVTAEYILRAIRDVEFDRDGLRQRVLARHSWDGVAARLIAALDRVVRPSGTVAEAAAAFESNGNAPETIARAAALLQSRGLFRT